MPAAPQNPIRPAGPLWIGQLLGLLAMGLLVACSYRLLWLEKNKGPERRAEADRQQRSQTAYPACRGSIYDSNPNNPGHPGTVLAASCLLDSIYVDPKLLGEEKARRRLMEDLGKVLELSPSIRGSLLKELDARCQDLAKPAEDEEPAPPPGTDLPPAPNPEEPAAKERPPAREHAGSRCLWVKRRVTPEESRLVRKLIRDNKYRGIVPVPELTRVYPNGQLASHVIGFVGRDGEPLAGLEMQFDHKIVNNKEIPILRGLDGSKKVIATAQRQPLWSSERDFVPWRDGLSLVLNINAVIQENVEQILEATIKHFAKDGAKLADKDKTSGVAIVMDVHTGAVLALANYPTFSLEEETKGKADPRLRNRALTDPFEPGSIFKWIVVAGAIERKVVTENDVFVSEGVWRDPANGRSIREAHDHAYGPLSVRMVVVKSSNIGMSKIGLKMGRDLLYKTVSDFGMGQKTGIELSQGESSGVLHPLNRWTSYSVPSVSFGQEIQVTPMQMLTGFCAVCNGGFLLRPRLVQSVIDDSPTLVGEAVRVVEDYTKPVGRRIISDKTSKTMVSILSDVVTKGTGQTAKSDKVVIFGKTGTAQIFEHGHDTGDFTGSFICGAPAEDPKIAVIVSIRKPKKSVGYFGGTVAAPAAKQIIEDTLAFLNYAPVMSETPHQN